MKKWMLLNALWLTVSACFAGSMGATAADSPYEGLSLGLGASYNAINVTQKSWGRGISNIQTSTGANSNGIAQGYGAPFHNTSTTFAPEIQASYFKTRPGTQQVYGLKLAYQYLGEIVTNSNLYIPQLGQTTSSTGTTSALFGYVNADSVQPAVNHELTLLAFIGHVFGNNYVYVGAGPSLFTMQSKNYYSIGYADYEGVTLDVTGLVSYSSPTLWALGGAAQLGMTYFINPTWTIDASYTYAMTGNNRTAHQQAFLNSSSIGSTQYTTSGTLFTRDTLRVSTQSVTVSINKVFDV